MSNNGLFSGLTEKPPEDLLDCDEIEPARENSSQSLDSSVSESPTIRSLPIKNYANDLKSEVKTSATVQNKTTDSMPVRKGDNTKENSAQKSKFRKMEAEPVTSVLRRSSRANKGIGKEIFDPSHTPNSQKRYQETTRFNSPNTTDRSLSPSSSVTSSPSSGKGRIVIGQSPRRRKHTKIEQDTAKDVSTDDDKKEMATTLKKEKDVRKELATTLKKEKGEAEDAEKPTMTIKKEHQQMMSKEDFSDDDDNVPLNMLKPETSSSSSAESDSDDDSDDSYNNPDRLWCICRKPHNNRFMISCDECEDWFHGDCVGISLQRGKKMEQNNEEYVCPKCTKKPIQDKPHKRSATLDEKLKSSGRTLKGYALLGQIQPSSNKSNDTAEEHPPKKKVKVFKEADNKKRQESAGKLESSSSRKCIVSSCNNQALHGSVYCSNQCILRHAKESLKTLTKEKSEVPQVKKVKPDSKNVTAVSSKQKNLDPNKRIPVACRKTRKILRGSFAPRRKELPFFLKTHPTYKVFRPKPAADRPEKAPENSLTTPETPSNSTSSSVDFYKHVEHQNRKRDRYNIDPEYVPSAKKLTEHQHGMSIPDMKHPTANYVNKISSQSVKVPSKSNQSSAGVHKSSLQSKSSGNKSDQSASSLNKPPRQRKESLDSAKKQDASKSSERRENKTKEHKDHKARHPSDSPLSRKHSEEKSAKKVERSGSGSKQEGKTTQTNSSEIRQNIKKSLYDILKTRSENSEDLKMHSDSIMRLATKIEESLYKVHGETNMKYKNKYRSIMFNLKDVRNHGLWRKVIIGEVTTSELVQMTAEQMASKKLAEWRKNELTQELDIIQKQEKEKANIRPVAKITHKGEIAIQEDLSDLTENFNRDASSAPTVAPTRKKRISLSEDDHFNTSTTSLPNDTTSQHHDHLFDLNCKICTGKVKEEDVDLGDAPVDSVKKVKRSTSIILSSEAQHASSSTTDSSAPVSHIVISEKPRRKKRNRELQESNVKSHDSSLSPALFFHNLNQEKQRKKKPVLPSPPPLKDIPERDPEPETETAPSLESAKEKAESETHKSPMETDVPAPPVETKAKCDEDKTPVKPVKSKLIWSGSISMLELSTFKANVYPVSGCYDNLDIDLPTRLLLGGRIHPKVVWDYLCKISNLPNKQLSVVRFHAATDDDRVGYVAMLSYFSSRKRFGVVSNQDRLLVKDMYLIPLLESQPIPEQLALCSADAVAALPPNRPSMLLGIVVRHTAKTGKSTAEAEEKPTVKAPPAPEKAVRKDVQPAEEEEYIPDDEPLIQEKTPSPKHLLTDEEVASKNETKSSSGTGSLFERNRSLAPSLRFFMRKQSEEEQSRKEMEEAMLEEGNQPYSPGQGIEKESEEDAYDPELGINPDEEEDVQEQNENEDDDEEPYDPEQEEEYDPETAFAPISPKDDENIPYDPEDDEQLIKESPESNGVDELVEKQAFLEKMQRELEEKKAKLAEVEQSLQQTTSAATDVAPQVRVLDPRLARRAAQEAEKSSVDETSKPKAEMAKLTDTEKKEAVKPSLEPANTAETLKPVVPVKPSEPPKPQPKPADPLQTILSVLNMNPQPKNIPTSSATVANALKIFQKPSSPPQLPDSTTKSDPEDSETPADKDEESVLVDAKQENSGLVAYPASPDSCHGNDDADKQSKKKDERRRRSNSSSSASSRDDDRRRHRHDYDDKRHRRHRRSRSRSPYRRGRHSPRHHRRHDDEHRHKRRSWSRDRRR